MTRDDAPVERPDDLSAEWLTATIGAGRVGDFTVERIGTGQMSECYRVRLTYGEGEGPASVVLKVAAGDPQSRGTGQALGLYEREVRFYAEVAPRLSAGGESPIAHCYHASYQPDTGMFTLLLDDAAPAVTGDEIQGATLDDAKLALRQLGRLHAPLIGSETLADAAWLNRESPVNQTVITGLFGGFTDRYGEAITPQQRLVCQKLVDSFDGYLAQEAQRVKGLVHGDYRLDNMLFGCGGQERSDWGGNPGPGSLRDLTVVDWQTVTRGPAMTDAAYFLGCALTTADRRAHYDDLLDAYYQGLGPNPPVTRDEVREGVRRQSFFGVMMAIVSSMLVERTERGDRMFLTMLDRHSSHVLDTGALDVLPPAVTAERKPCVWVEVEVIEFEVPCVNESAAVPLPPAVQAGFTPTPPMPPTTWPMETALSPEKSGLTVPPTSGLPPSWFRLLVLSCEASEVEVTPEAIALAFNVPDWALVPRICCGLNAELVGVAVCAKADEEAASASALTETSETSLRVCIVVPLTLLSG